MYGEFWVLGSGAVLVYDFRFFSGREWVCCVYESGEGYRFYFNLNFYDFMIVKFRKGDSGDLGICWCG